MLSLSRFGTCLIRIEKYMCDLLHSTLTALLAAHVGVRKDNECQHSKEQKHPD